MKYLNIQYFCFDNVCESLEAHRLNEYKIPELKNCKVIALGNEVSNFLWCKEIKHFMLPHPSPLNRKLNDMEYVKSQLNECRLFLEGAS